MHARYSIIDLRFGTYEIKTSELSILYMIYTLIVSRPETNTVWTHKAKIFLSFLVIIEAKTNSFQDPVSKPYRVQNTKKILKFLI